MTTVSRTERTLPRAKQVLLVVLYVLFLAILLEVLARGFWVAKYRVPMVASGHAIHPFYPELGKVEQDLLADTTEGYDILLLGGSVMHPEWSSIAAALQETLSRDLAQRVRVHNLAAPGHTSRDSYLKYAHLQTVRFDAVFLYNGINDVRANNVPDSMFRADYSHFTWYGLVNQFLEDDPLRPTAVPYTAEYVFSRLRARLGFEETVAPTDPPRVDWLEYGADVKTGASVLANASAIADLAAERGERLVVGTFAGYIPPDYSRERFDRRELDYLLHLMPVEMWGLPSNVKAALETQNEGLRTLGQREGVEVVDFDLLMPRGGREFNDVCHLTQEGSSEFSAILAPVVARLISGERASP